MREINASRDLTGSIERSKHDLHEQVMALTIENEKLQSNIHRLESEKEVVGDQLRAEVCALKLKMIETQNWSFGTCISHGKNQEYQAWDTRHGNGQNVHWLAPANHS